jgi:hypothetical protein
VGLGDNARLIVVIPDREFHLSRDEIAALSRRLVGSVRSPLVSLTSEGEHALTIVDPAIERNRDYILQLVSPSSQLLELSVYGRYLVPWPGYRLLAEWLKHHLACEVYLGSDYGRPWVPFDPDTVARENQRHIHWFLEDTSGSSLIELPWPEGAAIGPHAVIAARFGLNRFSPALESLCDILAHHRKYQGKVPIPADGPAMVIFDVLPEPRSHNDNSIWQPVYRPDDPTFAIPHAHRFAVIPTTLPFADPTNLDAWPFARFLLEVLTLGLGGDPVYGAANESDAAKRPRLLSSDEMTKITRTYLRAT